MEKNKCLESIIQWLTFLLGNELFIFYLVKNLHLLRELHERELELDKN